MLPHSAVLDSSSLAYSERVALSDDGKTNVHVFSRALRDTVISVANLGSAQRVLDVCQGLGGPVVAAMSGGFFARADRKPLGDAATDLEGFSAGSDQFDSDITAGRYPRAAIGHDGAYVYSVVVDGRSDSDVGMTLHE